MMRHTHPNPLRNETEAQQRRGAQDLSALVAEAVANGAVIHRPDAAELRDLAEQRAAALSATNKKRGRRGGIGTALRPASQRAQAWKNGVVLP